MSPILFVLLNTNCKPWFNAPTLNVNLTLFVIPCNFFGEVVSGILETTRDKKNKIELFP